MSGGPVSVSGPPRPPKGTTPRLAPKARHDRRADPRHSSHRKPVRAPTAPSGGAGTGMSAKRPNDRQEPYDIQAKSLSLAIPSEAGGTRGIREAAPKTADKSRTASGHGPLPRHSIRSGQKTGGSGKGRKRREKEGRRRKAGKSESRKAGRPGESRKAGKKQESRETEKSKSRKQETGKPKNRKTEKPGRGGSRKARKPESRKAGKRAKT